MYLRFLEQRYALIFLPSEFTKQNRKEQGMVKILTKKTGNCHCRYCDKLQEGFKLHPYTVWHKIDGEKRGHNEPVCSRECAELLAKKIEEDSDYQEF